jgi:hypothetical protein
VPTARAVSCRGDHNNAVTLEPKESGAVIAINHVHQILGWIKESTGQKHWVIWTLQDHTALLSRLAAGIPPRE